MLINLSNHPATSWGAPQRAAAAPYGPIEDWPFPAIPPEWDDRQVAALAKRYAHQIINRLREAGPGLHAVHVMGEQTFTCTLVQLVQREGIIYLAATSHRIVEEDPARGRKIAYFRFVRFQKYPVC